jgi:carboxyl-terminal processing protease
MLASLDPYTVYFNEQDVLRFKINNTGEYTGIAPNLTIVREVYKTSLLTKLDLNQEI